MRNILISMIIVLFLYQLPDCIIQSILIFFYTYCRENEIVGKYLVINNVDTSDFGSYYCTISNTGDQKIVMETTLKRKLMQNIYFSSLFLLLFVYFKPIV